MLVFVDDEQPVDVEQLTLDEARVVLARAQEQLPRAFNSAHVAHLHHEIEEVSEQIEWLEDQERQHAGQEAASEHRAEMWADYAAGLPA
ncbi:MAG: hypothetical protein K0U84_20060 [Actinomycetia bacterium]|nr:hypothetical protein [Actinomycetes bacterium]